MDNGVVGMLSKEGNTLGQLQTTLPTDLSVDTES
jgi:hypothetical protein